MTLDHTLAVMGPQGIPRLDLDSGWGLEARVSIPMVLPEVDLDGPFANLYPVPDMEPYP